MNSESFNERALDPTIAPERSDAGRPQVPGPRHPATPSFRSLPENTLHGEGDEERDRHPNATREVDIETVSLRSSVSTLLPTYEEVVEDPTGNRETAKDWELEEKRARFQSDNVSELSTARTIRQTVTPTTIPHPMGDRKVWRESRRFSVALNDQTFFAVSPWRIHHNLADMPAVSKKGKLPRHEHHVSLVSLGSVLESSGEDGSVDRVETYCALFSDRSWSTRLASGYPELTAHIDRLGIADLEFCVLGPDQIYLARWVPRWPLTERTWMTNGPERASAYLKYLQDCGEQPLSVTFGCGKSWFIACDTRHGYCSAVTYRYELDGLYPDLNKFIAVKGGPSRRDFIIEGIALNPANTTDYVLVYRENWTALFHLKMYISDPAVSDAIEAWWNGEKGDAGSNLFKPTKEV